MHKYIVEYTALGSTHIHETVAFRSGPGAETEVARRFEAVGRRDRIKVISVTCAACESVLAFVPKEG